MAVILKYKYCRTPLFVGDTFLKYVANVGAMSFSFLMVEAHGRAMTQNKSGHSITKGTSGERGNNNNSVEGESRRRRTNKGCRLRWGARKNPKGGQYGYIIKIVFDQFVILSSSDESKEISACQKDERCHGREWSHQQRDKGFSRESVRSPMKIRNKMGA